MKLIFKQQPYRTDATMAVVRCFEGQCKEFTNAVRGYVYGVMWTWVILDNDIMKHGWTDIPTGF